MEIDSTEVVSILNESGETSSTVQRVYSNALKKAFDKTMDFRYFVRFDVHDHASQPLFTCKKYLVVVACIFEARI